MTDDIAPAAAATEGTLSDGIVPDDEENSFTRRAIRRAIMVAWLAVFAGVAVQVLVLAMRLLAGAEFVGA